MEKEAQHRMESGVSPDRTVAQYCATVLLGGLADLESRGREAATIRFRRLKSPRRVARWNNREPYLSRERMAEQDAPPSASVGFLTVVEDADHGRFGGYLVLNAAGRPLEFHCTAPVKPNRAQEILFGPTLAPYLEGELIAAALFARSKSPPLLLCTDRPAILAVRAMINVPVLLSLADGDAIPAGLAPLALGANRTAASPKDREVVLATCAAVLPDLDLHEPFVRIREALDEARSSAAGKMRPAA